MPYLQMVMVMVMVITMYGCLDLVVDLVLVCALCRSPNVQGLVLSPGLLSPVFHLSVKPKWIPKEDPRIAISICRGLRYVSRVEKPIFA